MQEVTLNKKILVYLVEVLRVIDNTRAKEFRIKLKIHEVHIDFLDKVTTNAFKTLFHQYKTLKGKALLLKENKVEY